MRVTLREIRITDDGDLIGDGEPLWSVRLSWAGGAAFGCFPNTDVGFGGVCQAGSYGEGRLLPRNNHGEPLAWTFAEETFDRFPAAFALFGQAEEWDWPFLPCTDCGFGRDGQLEWRIPTGVESAATPATTHVNSRNGELRSTMAFTFELFHDGLSYPSQRNAPGSTWRSPFGR